MAADAADDDDDADHAPLMQISGSGRTFEPSRRPAAEVAGRLVSFVALREATWASAVARLGGRAGPTRPAGGSLKELQEIGNFLTFVRNQTTSAEKTNKQTNSQVVVS